MRSTETSIRETTAKEQHQQLIQAIASSACVNSYTNLFILFAPRLHSYGLGHLASYQLACELVQETMSTVWHKANLYNVDKGSVACWIFAIARNVRVDIQRQDKATDCIISDSQTLLEQLGNGDDLETETRVANNELVDFFTLLPVKQQLVLKGIYLEGKSQWEVAEEMNVPVGTVKSRARLGVERLKQVVCTE